MVCKNEQAILEKKNLLLSWLQDDPTKILKLLKKMNTATPESEYIEDLTNVIASKFKRGCKPENLTLEKTVLSCGMLFMRICG